MTTLMILRCDFCATEVPLENPGTTEGWSKLQINAAGSKRDVCGPCVARLFSALTSDAPALKVVGR